MAITAVSKLQPRGAAQLIHVCQSLAVWKGRRQFDSRKTFPLLFTGSGLGGGVVYSSQKKQQRGFSVWTGYATTPRCGTASWNDGDVHAEFHGGRNHTFAGSRSGTRGLESTKGCKKMRISKGLKKRSTSGKRGRLLSKTSGWLWRRSAAMSRRDKALLPAMPVTKGENQEDATQT